MSKPDPASGSLESILASIRKSLAEQSGEVPNEPHSPAASSAADSKPAARRHGLSQRLAGTAPETTTQSHAIDDLSDLLESPSAPAPQPPAPERAEPAQSEDPLWFLSRRDEAPPPAQRVLANFETPAAPPAAVPAPAEPKLTRPEVLRASMPPFFGASSDGGLPEPEPAAEQPAASPPAPEPPPAAPPSVAPPSNASMAHEVSLVAAAVESATSRPAAPPAHAALNGRAPATPPAAAAPPVPETPANRALEAAVLELLKPMLRQWLDENMPRMVAQALGEEGVRKRAPEGDGKKM